MNHKEEKGLRSLANYFRMIAFEKMRDANITVDQVRERSYRTEAYSFIRAAEMLDYRIDGILDGLSYN